MCRKLAVLLAVLQISMYSSALAQNWGIEIGLMGNFGKQLSRFGIVLNSYYARGHWQENLRSGLYYTLRVVGPPLSTPELQINLGIAYALGAKNWQPAGDAEFLTNKTQYHSIAGYCINFYKDRLGTSQRTGTIWLQTGHLAFYTENDLFAAHSDHFRTGAARLAWIDTISFSFNLVTWTPETKNVPVQTDPDYPARWGYKDLTRQKYGRFSTGFMYLQLGYQEFSAGLGYESEWIRYVFQNKLIHDMIFLPKFLVPAKMKHYPMVSAQGNAYLFKPNQRVKPGRMVYFIAKNRGMFY